MDGGTGIMAELTRGQILQNPEVIGFRDSVAASIKIYDANASNYVEIKAAANIATDFTLTLPADDGASSQFLQTNGSGVLSWQTVTATPGGSTTQIQYNNAGNLAGAAGLTTDGTHLTITAAGEIRFADTDSSNYVAFKSPGTVAANRLYTLPATIGSAGQVLKLASGATSTAATLEWADDLQGAGATAAGADTYIQFNDGGTAFGGDAGFTYNKTTDSATLVGSLTAGSVIVNNLTIDNNSITASTGDVELVGSTAVAVRTNKPLRLYDADNSNYVGLASVSAVTGNYTLTFPAAVGAADDIMSIDGSGNISFINNYRTLNFIIENSASTITTGVKGYVQIDFDCQVIGWTILGSGESSAAIVVDVWKDTYANFPPTVADTIAGTEKPTITSGNQKGQDTSITTWASTTVNGVSTVGGIAAGDILAFNVDSITNFTRVTVALKLKPL